MKTRKLKQMVGTVKATPRAGNSIGESALKPMPKENTSRFTARDPITEVTADIDVGLGNALFIRGQGDGLSWDKGTPMVCKRDSTWVWSTRKARGKLVFKLLLNDVTWSQGEDIVIQAGGRIQVVPGF